MSNENNPNQNKNDGWKAVFRGGIPSLFAQIPPAAPSIPTHNSFSALSDEDEKHGAEASKYGEQSETLPAGAKKAPALQYCSTNSTDGDAAASLVDLAASQPPKGVDSIDSGSSYFGLHGDVTDKEGGHNAEGTSEKSDEEGTETRSPNKDDSIIENVTKKFSKESTTETPLSKEESPVVEETPKPVEKPTAKSPSPGVGGPIDTGTSRLGEKEPPEESPQPKIDCPVDNGTNVLDKEEPPNETHQLKPSNGSGSTTNGSNQEKVKAIEIPPSDGSGSTVEEGCIDNEDEANKTPPSNNTELIHADAKDYEAGGTKEKIDSRNNEAKEYVDVVSQHATGAVKATKESSVDNFNSVKPNSASVAVSSDASKSATENGKNPHELESKMHKAMHLHPMEANFSENRDDDPKVHNKKNRRKKEKKVPSRKKEENPLRSTSKRIRGKVALADEPIDSSTQQYASSFLPQRNDVDSTKASTEEDASSFLRQRNNDNGTEEASTKQGESRASLPQEREEEDVRKNRNKIVKFVGIGIEDFDTDAETSSNESVVAEAVIVNEEESCDHAVVTPVADAAGAKSKSNMRRRSPRLPIHKSNSSPTALPATKQRMKGKATKKKTKNVSVKGKNDSHNASFSTSNAHTASGSARIRHISTKKKAPNHAPVATTPATKKGSQTTAAAQSTAAISTLPDSTKENSTVIAPTAPSVSASDTSSGSKHVTPATRPSAVKAKKISAAASAAAAAATAAFDDDPSHVFVPTSRSGSISTSPVSDPNSAAPTNDAKSKKWKSTGPSSKPNKKAILHAPLPLQFDEKHTVVRVDRVVYRNDFLSPCNQKPAKATKSKRAVGTKAQSCSQAKDETVRLKGTEVTKKMMELQAASSYASAEQRASLPRTDHFQLAVDSLRVEPWRQKEGMKKRKFPLIALLTPEDYEEYDKEELGEAFVALGKEIKNGKRKKPKHDILITSSGSQWLTEIYGKVTVQGISKSDGEDGAKDEGENIMPTKSDGLFAEV